MALAKKTFKEVKVDDQVFYINMEDASILKSTVVDIHHYQDGKTVLKFFRAIKNKSGIIAESHLKAIYEQEDQEKVFLDVIVKSSDTLVTLLIKPPTALCTTEEELAKYMKGESI